MSVTRRESLRGWLPWVIFSLDLVLALYAGGAERGLPLITVFPSEVHKAGPQTFDIAQDSRGILYFGNLQGLLTYDGAWWRLRKLPHEQAALALASDARGRVAVGLVDDLGYMERDASGAEDYHSLLPLLPAGRRHIGDVRGICSTAAGFLYVAERSLIVWDGRTARVTPDLHPDDAPRGCFAEGNDVFVRGRNGLQRFDPVTLQLGASVGSSAKPSPAASSEEDSGTPWTGIIIAIVVVALLAGGGLVLSRRRTAAK